MPYVPSEKTDGKSQDRVVIDAQVELLARDLAISTPNNFDVLTAYKTFFALLAAQLHDAQRYPGDAPSNGVANAIWQEGKKYGYDGAFLGEMNYALTRLIQRVPQIKVELGQWPEKNELRYWLYDVTIAALTYAAVHFVYDEYGIGSIFEDVKDEYKRRVNTAYEAAQILKSGDCYDTPYYTRLIEVVDEEGQLIGHQEVMLKRSLETVHLDLLPYRIVVQTQPKALAVGALSDATGFAS